MSKSERQADFDLDTPVDHNFHLSPSEKLKRWEASLPSAYWDYRSKWETHPRERIVESFPIHLDIEATSACNLKCIMCPRTEMIESGTFWKVKAFDFVGYCNLIDEGARNGLCSVKFNYLGEPTLNPRLVEMIRYAKQAGVLDVMFNTNAMLLTEKLSRQLIEAGLDKLFFSFDSPYPEKYERIRVGADFYQSLGNIRRFMEIREEFGSLRPFTRVSIVRMKDNQDEWEAFQALFDPIVDAVAHVDYLEHTSQTNSERHVVEIGSRKNKFCCPQLWQRAFVHPDGIVTACCIDSAREMPMGNVFEQPLSEIWQGEQYQRMRSLHASGRFTEVPICSRCPLARY